MWIFASDYMHTMSQVCSMMFPCMWVIVAGLVYEIWEDLVL